MGSRQVFAHDDEVISDFRDQIKSLESKIAEARGQSCGGAHARHDSLSDPASRIEVAEEAEEQARLLTHPTNANTIPKVRKCNFVEFKNHFTEEDGRYAVDVLVSGRSTEQEIHGEQRFRERRSEYENPTTRSARMRANAVRAAYRDTTEALRKAQAGHSWIQRIRLQAPALLKTMSNIQKQSWSLRPRTFFRPFTTLIYFQPQMKEALAELESRWGMLSVHHEGATPATTREHTPSPFATHVEEEPAENSRAAVAILRCYVEFIDREIMSEYTRFDKLGVDDDAGVRFSDLHFLFRTGELIYRPLESEIPGQRDFRIGERVWRVYGIRSCDIQYQITPSDHRKYDVQDRGEEDGAFVVRAYYIEYTGEEFCTVTKSFSIPPFTGIRKVTSLPVHPMRFARDHEELLDIGVQIGDKMLHYLDTKQGSYNAWTVMKTPKGDPVWDVDGVIMKHPEHINSEIMIDFAEAFQACPTWRPKRTILKPRPVEQIVESDDFPILWYSGPDRAKVLAETSEVVPVRTGVNMWEQNKYVSEDELLAKMAENDARVRFTKKEFLRREDKCLIACRVFAYVFQERKFSQLDIMWVSEPTGSRDALDSLRIPQRMKDTIQNSVRGHLLQKAAETEVGEARMTQDIIKGKGTGLFILLYGAPGVGKTATAEAIAQTNKKPLFKITCGDLGLTPEQVETKLRGIFRLASLWDCILLMDEVDTFFSQRSKGDGAMTKNALVSVFLRILDYYTGILFMTTNLPGALDEAFKSRIHYKIHFPLLSRQQTLEIWQINLHRLRRMELDLQQKTSRQPMEIHDEEILRFAETQFNSNSHWNGRQIRNAFQVARSLAYADADAEADRLRSSNPQGDMAVPAPRLQVKHFQVMDEITSSFDQYMQQVYSGMNDADLARENEHRADDFVFRRSQHGDIQTQQQMFDYRSGGGLAPGLDAMGRSHQSGLFRPRGQGSIVGGHGSTLSIPRGGNYGDRRSPSPRRGPFDTDMTDNGPLPGYMQAASQLLSPASHRHSIDGAGLRPISPGTSPIQARHVGRGSGDYGFLGNTRNDDVECYQGYGDCKNEYGKRERDESR
ncbi:hypothetical protein B0T16DRAFT_383304 [Cercophora newfieldiana]|uniref:AAA+ ATPase domain-containing protein n=1 Tax=Cercophora newfieldiana TaxID=92897 RepID=A0AA40CJN7_9PEZI|nr:hypothetical protein B0T16DRAFT_383304 [Cercophora newfieldiana]